MIAYANAIDQGNLFAPGGIRTFVRQHHAAAGSRAEVRGRVASSARPLFESDVVTIADVRCGSAGPCAVASLAAGWHLVFTRAGVAVLECDMPAEPSVAGPMEALYLTRHAVSLRHRHRDGHECTVLSFARDPFCDRAAAGTQSTDDDSSAPVERLPLLTATALVRFHGLRGALLNSAASGSESASWVEARALDLLRLVRTSRVASAHSLPDGVREPARRRGKRASQLRRREMVETVRAVISAAPAEAHPLSDLAGAFAVSPSHLAHVFRAEAGIPVHQYLLQTRFAIALERLSSETVQLSRLAVDLGFASHSHFTASFHHCFGMPPGELRESLTSRRFLRS